VTYLGLPIIAATNLGARFLAGVARHQANILLGAGVAEPPPVRARSSRYGYLRAHILDPAAWRARPYLLLKLPMGIATFATAVALYTYGLGGLSYAIWRPFRPCNDNDSRVCHCGAELWSDHTLDSAPGIALTALIGRVMLLLAPWVVRAVVTIDNLLIRALLGPTESSIRVAELEQTRAHAVDDSAATLRRIERDLHDGTQARLVALALNVGLAREKLAEGADPAEAQRLLESAHSTAKEAIVELRDLARGIYPPVLDAGLDTALATLAAHSAARRRFGRRSPRDRRRRSRRSRTSVPPSSSPIWPSTAVHEPR
jgi:signal transduction histidine kinase